MFANSRGTGGATTSCFGAHEHAVPWPATAPLVGADLDLDELGDLFSVSCVRLAAVRAAAFPRFNDLYLYRQGGVRPATRAAAPDGAGPLVPCRLSASVGSARSCDRTFQACGCAPRALPRSASSSRFLIFASSCVAHAKLVRRRGGLHAFQLVARRLRTCPRPTVLRFPERRLPTLSPRDASASRRASSRCRIASSRCRRIVASSKIHCLPVAQKSGVASSMKVQGSKFRVQSLRQIFSSPG